MKTARYILPLLAGVMFASPGMAQQIDPLFVYPGEDQTEEQLNQDSAECEMWTFEQIGFPAGYVADEDAGKNKVKKNAASEGGNKRPIEPVAVSRPVENRSL